MDKPTPTTTILACYRDEARDVLNKLAKKAARYGQSITWTEETFTDTRYRMRWDGKRVPISIDYIRLFINGSAPQIEGFKFLAKLEREGAGVMVTGVPGHEIGSFGWEWDGRCDHCGHKRARRLGYVVEGPDGRKIIGSGCVGDYVGRDVPAHLLSVFTAFRAFEAIGEEEEGFGGGGRWELSTLGTIAASRAAVALYGYRKHNPDSGTVSTRQIVDDIRGRSGAKTQEGKTVNRELQERGEHYFEDASKVMEWGRNLDPKSDFEQTLKVILSSGSFGSKYLGQAAYAGVAYDRAIAEAQAAEEQLDQPYVGEIKKRMVAVLLLENIYGIESVYGPQVIYTFRDEEGRVLRWKTSTYTNRDIDGQNIEIGSKLEAKFTVKEHAEYKGKKFTSISRCAFARVAPQVA